MLETTARAPLPPYVPYRTFTTFLDSLKVGIPSHIDKSVMTSMSGGMQSWLKASLRVMKLVDADGIPQDRLRKLVHAQGEERKALLRDLFNSIYAPLFKGVIDLQTTTPQKLRSVFVDIGAQGETVEKCMAFLTALARDSGLTLSPHLMKRAAPVRRKSAQTRTARGVANTPALAEPSALGNGTDGGSDLKAALLAKFPTFDPAWPSDVQAKWFDAFDRLMKTTSGS